MAAKVCSKGIERNGFGSVSVSQPPMLDSRFMPRVVLMCRGMRADQ
jgi:hypothetical protein